MNFRSIIVLAILSLAGCAPSVDPNLLQAMSALDQDRQLDALTYKAVDRMLESTPQLTGSVTSIVVGSVEDIHDVNTSTPFGNIVSEMVRTRLVQRGLLVKDLRIRSSVLLERTGGEMMLSRDRRAVLPAPAATEFVTGTYAVASGKVFVSLKIVAAADGRIEAASDFVTDRTIDVDRLLWRNQM